MKPPSAGPTMVALWFAVAEPATARGTSGSGTRLGTMVCIAVSSKARAPPITNATPRISSREIAPETAAIEQHGRHDRFDRLAGRQDEAAVVAIGHLPDHQHQQDAGDELHQADEAEVERVAGQLVELPADRHHQHLVAGRGRDPRKPEQHERAVLQDGVWMFGSHRGTWDSLYGWPPSRHCVRCRPCARETGLPVRIAVRLR